MAKYEKFMRIFNKTVVSILGFPFILFYAVVFGGLRELIICYTEMWFNNKNTIKKEWKIDWEQIDPCHQRCKVFGGWLVKAYENVAHVAFENGYRTAYEDKWDWRVAMTFVPDPRHEWEIGSNEDVR